MSACPHCGAPWATGAAFCVECGTRSADPAATHVLGSPVVEAPAAGVGAQTLVYGAPPELVAQMLEGPAAQRQPPLGGAPPAPRAEGGGGRAPEVVPIAGGERGAHGPFRDPRIAPVDPRRVAQEYRRGALQPPIGTLPGLPSRRRTRWGLGVAVGVAVGTVVLAVIAIVQSIGAPLEGSVEADDRGVERLTVNCPRCPDGAEMVLDGLAGTVKGGKATLPMARALPVGTNTLKVAVKAPGATRYQDEDVQVVVPFRWAVDASGWSADPPQLRLSLNAAPGSTLLVDGRAVNLDAEGRGLLAVEVRSDISGPASEVRPLSRSLPFELRSDDGATRRGSMRVELRVTPLLLDAPVATVITDGSTFLIAGRTAAGGSVTVGGRSLPVDGEGRFSQLMNISSAGETNVAVVGSAPDHAPRAVEVKVRRVLDLTAEAARFRAGAATTPDGLDSLPADHPIALLGTVREVVPQGHRTRYVVEVSDCAGAGCSVLFDLGGPPSARIGDRLRLHGWSGGTSPQGGRTLPVVRGGFAQPEK